MSWKKILLVGDQERKYIVPRKLITEKQNIRIIGSVAERIMAIVLKTIDQLTDP